MRFVWPAWHQVIVIIFACLGGAFTGVLIQRYFGAPMRYEEWPLLGLMIAALFALASSCLRRNREEK